ncbi:5'-nucleotidase [Friedmanniella luteola]|uniref:5'-nucleotidase n=1 Tax=Friedmanniella luteola TaxID=546871 RepID=A0A1H1URK2_9ACTN|nr:5'-nucleotidase C-terminal domain-containing protein [Friedmanniella luteola]SDS74900.1 5'-nucleotidase [Friedmanniella luteola]
MSSPSRVARRLGALSMAAAVALSITVPVAADAAPRRPGAKPKTVAVRVMSFNDLHGNLANPTGSSARVQIGGGKTLENNGGAAYLARHVEMLRYGHPNSVLLSTGDSIGASPLASALFHDEPTVEVLNAMGVKASVVGNHEFDEGLAELRRIEHGGCHPTDGCDFRTSYEGTDFPFLGANITFESGKRAFQPFSIQKQGGVKIGVIGVTLRDLPDVVTPAAVAGLRFTDEVAAINRTSKLLQSMGVKAQVVLMHQGDETSGTGSPNSCDLGEEQLARQIASRSTARVDAFFAGHTHQAENCTVTDPAGHPRPLIQGLSFGRLISVVDLAVSTRTQDVVRSRTRATNVVVTRDVRPDAEVQAIVDRAVDQAAPLANRQIGSTTGALLRGSAPEQPLGDVIADAQLAATTGNGAQVAITNPGGIRADLDAGPVTYGEAFSVQPFANILQTITLTGAQLDAVLEQQQKTAAVQPTWLQVSSTLGYTWTTSAAPGSKVSKITVAGQPVDPAASYRVTVNNFLAAGGDGFDVFAQGTGLTGGPIDLDAFVAYLSAHPALVAPAADRITVVP